MKDIEIKLEADPTDKLLEENPVEIINRSTSNNSLRSEGTRPDESRYLQEPTTKKELETPYQRRLRKKSHLVIYATTFIMSIGFSVVLTGVWPYLKKLDPSASKEFLGWVIAINPLGQMFASPILGWWGGHRGSNRLSFILTILLFIVGNILYAILPLFDDLAKHMMLLSRFIVGISSANIAICRSYISSSTMQAERTISLSIIAAAQSMGYILGPCLQTALAYAYPNNPKNYTLLNGTDAVGSTDNYYDEPIYDILFNMYSLTGWITALLGFLNLFIMLPCVYKEFNIAQNEERSKDDDKNSSSGTRERATDFVAIAILLFGYFSILLIYVLLETLIVPMCLDLYAWTPEFTVKVVGLGLTVAGVITFFVFILSGQLAKIFNDRKIFILCGLVPLTLSMLIFFPVAGETPKIKYCASPSDGVTNSSVTSSIVRRAAVLNSHCEELGCPSSQKWCFYTPRIHLPQLVTACFLTTLGYPVGISLAGAIFSKMLRVKEQGLWMGILTSSGSLSRFLGPIFVSYLYTAKGPLWTFAVLFVLLLIVVILHVLFYKRMAPLSKPT
ncbi:UNVERIFIED_CONTAM: hypothetical protein GTU68_062566 [Idotea baltica]|nr:hypothetical protein [Idotea baltica]